MAAAPASIATRYLERLEGTVTAYEKVLTDADDAKRGRRKDAADIVARKNDCKDTWMRYKPLFRQELERLTPGERGRLQSRFDRAQQRYKDCSTAFRETGIEADANRDELMAGGTGTGHVVLGQDAGNTEFLTEAERIARGNVDELRQGHRELVGARENVDNANLELKEQGEKLEGVRDDLEEIESEVDRARVLITRFMRRMYTDKVIIAFVCLIVAAIAGIIIYSTVEGDQDTFDVPDKAQPPNPRDVSRMLRGTFG